MTFPNGDIFEGTYVKCEIPDPVAVAEAEAAAAEAAAAAAEASENAEAADGDAPAAEEEEKPPLPTIPTSMRQGKGRYVFAPLVPDQELSGGYHEGEYVDNKKHGPGVMVFPDGSKYEGPFVEDAMTGECKYTYASSGDVYSGAFVDGKKHGQGSYLFKASQSTFMGRWENGAFVEGEWILRDGSTYKGVFVDGKPAGEGTFSWAKNGTTQSGSWGEDGAFVGGPITAEA